MSDEKSNESKKGQFSRRQVLLGTGAAIAAGTLSTAAPLVGSVKHELCTGTSGVSLADQVWDFEKQPPAIPDSQIAETQVVDIVIVGTGAAGMPCIASALETGAKVIALEKLSKAEATPTPDRPDKSRAIGAWYGFVGSRLYKERKIPLDKEALVAAKARASLWRCDQRQINKIARYGELVANWWLDILQEQGIDPDTIPIEVHAEKRQQALPTQPPPRPGQSVYWHPMGHVIPAGRAEQAFEKHLNDNGFQITYETPVKQLLKEGNRITGVIAKGPKGYLKIKANKAVILCTGGYEGNTEMVKKYLPEYKAYKVVVGKKTNTGDGYLMAKWIGARMEPWPGCSMTWDGMSPECIAKLKLDYVGIARQPWLYLNANGLRFMNEEAPFSGIGHSMYMQPHSMMWTIFDEQWRDDDVLERLGGTVCRRMTTRKLPFILPMNTKLNTEKMIEAGVILKANTIDELATKMMVEGPTLGIGADTSVKTISDAVTRYNQLCKARHDEDFGKDPSLMIAIEKPPYYACRTCLGLLVVQGGAMVNDNFQVLDEEGRVIPGLYACGNVAGGFNGLEYSMDADFGSLGRACVSGYIAARHGAGVDLPDVEPLPMSQVFQSRNA
jgi:succinate dehydrogenase/fumarate reductase flavoprotein subunit